MISRKSSIAISKIYERQFTKVVSSGTTYNSHSTIWAKPQELYDFLYTHDFPAWLCNSVSKFLHERQIQEWAMKLHTGETVSPATPNWSWEDRQHLGQQLLRELAEDMWQQPSFRLTSYDVSRLRHDDAFNSMITEMKRCLELDGFNYQNGILLEPERDVLDVNEETGVLHSLYSRLGLSNSERAFHDLGLSEEHYIADRWDDSIANSRQFLEGVLQEIAVTHSSSAKGIDLPESVKNRPVQVRDYLEREGLIETKEKDALSKVYGLLSETGSHPYMARKDQARLLRQMSLTLAQFAMLRLEGSQKAAVST